MSSWLKLIHRHSEGAKMLKSPNRHPEKKPKNPSTSPKKKKKIKKKLENPNNQKSLWLKKKKFVLHKHQNKISQRKKKGYNRTRIQYITFSISSYLSYIKHTYLFIYKNKKKMPYLSDCAQIALSRSATVALRYADGSDSRIEVAEEEGLEKCSSVEELAAALPDDQPRFVVFNFIKKNVFFLYLHFFFPSLLRCSFLKMVWIFSIAMDREMDLDMHSLLKSGDSRFQYTPVSRLSILYYP